MTDVIIYRPSVEMLRVAVASNRENVHEGSTVEFSFTTSEDEEPVDAVWTAGTWVSAIPTVERVADQWVEAYVAQVLVSATGGGGTVELDVGEHFAWVRVTLGSQEVVKPAGKVTVQ